MALEEKLVENAEIAADIVKKYLLGEIAGTDRVKIASLSITQSVKYKATKGATDALRFAVARSIAGNRDELKKQVRENMPGYIQTDQIENK
jgi:hypothetical protein